MKVNCFLKLMSLAVTLWLITNSISAQNAIRKVDANPPTDDEGTQWMIEVQFDATGTAKIGTMFLTNFKTKSVIPLDEKSVQLTAFGLTVLTLNKIDPIENQYLYSVEVTPNGEPESKFINGMVKPINFDLAKKAVVKAKAKGSNDANVYISGEINGANKKKTSFSTEISINSGEIKVAKNNFLTPIFFKLNASSDAGADPDTLEFGISYRYRFLGAKSLPAANLATTAKIESERDFGNTNFISESRLTILPYAFPKGEQNKLKIFVRPFIGLELGKNLRSPLAAAEGNFILRPLVGAKLRFNYPINEDEEREINWETVYTRRWLLRNELGFKTNDADELVLTEFGKSPRDYVQSKFSYGLAKYFDAFIAYDWGQVPPSYKLVDHRFRIGFAYKFKFAVK